MRELGNGLSIDDNGVVRGVRVTNRRKRQRKLSLGAQQALNRMHDQRIADAVQNRADVEKAFDVLRTLGGVA